jgi:hypothetical protein
MEGLDSSPTLFLKEESSALNSLHASNADGEKQASEVGLLPPLLRSNGNSTGRESFQLDKPPLKLNVIARAVLRPDWQPACCLTAGQTLD